MSENELLMNLNGLGLSDSGIGVWWIKKERDKFYYHHTESSAELYGKTLSDLPPSELYGEAWKKTADMVAKKHDTYREMIISSMNDILDLFAGKRRFCEYVTPWMNTKNEIIWLTDKVYAIQFDDSGFPTICVGLTINETVRKTRREKYNLMEEVNIKLRNANQRAIDLAKLLVWSMNYEEFPKGDKVFCNPLYAETLGITQNENGYILLSDFLRTKYFDLSGTRSMKSLMDKFNRLLQNKEDEFFDFVVKHKNLITGEAIYLKHNTRVDERFEDGTAKRVSGYIVDVTEKFMMEEYTKDLNKKNKELLLAQKLALESGKVMIWYLNSEESDNDSYFYGNDILFERLGIKKYRNSRFMIRDFNDTIYTEDDEGKELMEQYLKMDDLVEDNKSNGYTKVLVKHINRSNGEIFYFEHNLIVEERYPDGSLKIRGGFMTDVTQETEYKKRIEFLVKHDLVTGLNNRNMFEQYVSSHNLPRSYSLIVLDIDGLKFINDAFGHIKGDTVIKLLAKTLYEVFHSNSEIFRIGGDEFCIISKCIDHDCVNERVQKVKDAITKQSEQEKVAYSISVGYEIIINNEMPFSQAFTNAENIMYRRKLSDRNSRKSKTMDTVLETLNTKTEETKAHCDRLGEYAIMILQELEYHRVSDLDDMMLLCQVHDIGKITISEEILSKPGKLTVEEYSKIKTHSEAGYKIIKNIVDSDRIAEGVLYHHERFDGKGYPFKLTGEEIPLFAKVLSVVDAFDVMVTGRQYQPSKTEKEALNEIKACAGTQFDPVIVNAFLSAMNKKLSK